MEEEYFLVFCLFTLVIFFIKLILRVFLDLLFDLKLLYLNLNLNLIIDSQFLDVIKFKDNAIIFDALHVPSNLNLAKFLLKELSGIYCFRHVSTGKMYIGQAVNLTARIIEHIRGNKSNIRLQLAIIKYGIESFEFIIVEFVKDTSLLTTREQVHLDWLFSLPKDLRYNFCCGIYVGIYSHSRG